MDKAAVSVPGSSRAYRRGILPRPPGSRRRRRAERVADYPVFARRELEIVKTGLHCNTVEIRARDTSRLAMAAEAALRQGLEVWFCPQPWNKSPDATLRGCDTGGVIGISAAPHTTISARHRTHTIASVMDHFRYCADLVGLDHVGFGPDTL